MQSFWKCVFVFALFFFLACQKHVPTNEILIGEYEALTGSEAVYGKDTHRGVQMALDEANALGGVQGKPIRLILYDNQGKTEEAVTAITRLITQDKVVAVIGEVASTRSIAAGVIAQQYQVPMISTASTNPAVTEVGDYIFRVCFTDPFQGRVMARYAREGLRLKKVAIFRDVKSDYSVGLANVFKKRFQEFLGETVLDVGYTGGDLDFKSQINAIKKSKAEAIFLPGYYTDVGLIARQARELGFEGLLLGGDGWDSEALTEIGGASIEGGYFSNHFSPEAKNARVSAFVSKYKAKFGNTPNSSVALGYDAASLLVDSLKRSPTLTSLEVRKALATTQNFEGVTGTLKFDENRNVVKSAVVLKVASRNSFQFVTSILP